MKKISVSLTSILLVKIASAVLMDPPHGSIPCDPTTIIPGGGSISLLPKSYCPNLNQIFNAIGKRCHGNAGGILAIKAGEVG